jgi:uncharacterized protein YjbJ (UPF0337 family)
MNNEHAKGNWNETKGKVKEEVGHAFGNTKTETEGVVDQIKGKVQKGLGDLKDAVKGGVDRVLNSSDSSKH